MRQQTSSKFDCQSHEKESSVGAEIGRKKDSCQITTGREIAEEKGEDKNEKKARELQEKLQAAEERLRVFEKIKR